MSISSRKYKRVIIRRFLTVFLFVPVLAAGCSDKSYIGDFTDSDPIAAIMYESGTNMGQPYEGIVYREVLDSEKLIAKSDTPVLLVYLDDSVYSKNAISFIETIADDYKNDLLVVRVFVETTDNPENVAEMVQYFEVSNYPYFAMIKGGALEGAVVGYTATSEKQIINMILSAID